MTTHQESIERKRCVIYTRFSTDEQDETSTDDQISVCEKYAKEKGWSVGDVFSDEGISGYAVGNRPAYLRMYEAANRRAFDVLLVCDTTRLARSTDLDPIVRRFQFRKVRVIGVQDHFDTNSPTASMQAGLSGITSQQTISMISRRTHARHEAIVHNGGSAGGRAFGYKCVHDLHPTKKDKSGRPEIVAKRVEKNESEAAIVLQIFKWFAEDGLSPIGIAARLNAQQVPSPGSTWDRKVRRAGGWLGSTVSCILRNELYRGVYIWNRTKGEKDPDTGKTTYEPRPKEEWKTEKRPHLKIIDDALWERTANRLRLRALGRGPAIAKGIAESKRKRVGGAQSRYVLGSLLVCGSCHARLIGDGKDFICPSFASKACSNDLRVRRDELQDKVFTHLKSHLLSDEVMSHARETVEAEFRQEQRREEAALRKAAVSKEMRRLDEEEAEARRDTKLRPTALTAQLEAIERDREALRSAAASRSTPNLSRARALLAKMPEVAAATHRLLECGAKALADQAAVSAAREAIRQLLVDGSIVLQPDPTHTELVGEVKFVELGEHLLQVAGVKRRPTPTREAAPESQGNQEKATLVAGA